MKAIRTLVAAGLLLGATSVMADDPDPVEPTYPKTARAAFTFKLVDDFSITCADAPTISDRTKMVVETIDELKTVPALISCEVNASTRHWVLKFNAENGGKMADTEDATSFLKLSDGGPSYPGILDMWVGFTEVKGTTSLGTVVAAGTTVKTILIDATGALTTEGMNGNYIHKENAAYIAAEKLNLAAILDPAAEDGTAEAAARFRTMDRDTYTLEIRAAFVSPTADPASTAGTYKEYINIEIATAFI